MGKVKERGKGLGSERREVDYAGGRQDMTKRNKRIWT